MNKPGEFERLEGLRRHLDGTGPGIPVGVGDDAAVVEVGGAPVVVCVDVVVDDVHFTRDVSSMADIGWKSVAVNVSDLAAMGARPVTMVVGLQRPGALTEAEVEELYAGMAAATRAFGLSIVGGDTVTAPVLAVSVTTIGAPGPRVVTRSGAAAGDRVLLVGSLGAAAAALWGLREGAPVAESVLSAHRRPVPLPRSGLALAGCGATAMIDVSDGLGADAGHLAKASGVDLRLDGVAGLAAVPQEVVDLVPSGELPRLAFGGGEDFALLATVSAESVDACAAALDALDEAPWRWIGEVVPGTGRVWLTGDGEDTSIERWGYDHG